MLISLLLCFKLIFQINSLHNIVTQNTMRAGEWTSFTQLFMLSEHTLAMLWGQGGRKEGGTQASTLHTFLSFMKSSFCSLFLTSRSACCWAVRIVSPTVSYWRRGEVWGLLTNKRYHSQSDLPRTTNISGGERNNSPDSDDDNS